MEAHARLDDCVSDGVIRLIVRQLNEQRLSVYGRFEPAIRQRGGQLLCVVDVDHERGGLLSEPGSGALFEHMAVLEHDEPVARPVDVAHQVC